MTFPRAIVRNKLVQNSIFRTNERDTTRTSKITGYRRIDPKSFCKWLAQQELGEITKKFYQHVSFDQRNKIIIKRISYNLQILGFEYRNYKNISF